MQRLRCPVCLAVVLTIVCGVSQAADDGFKSIFDGKTLDGWDGNPKLWRVEDGAITGETTPENPTKGNTFLIWRGGQPGDFEAVFEFKMCSDAVNSGLQYRSREEPEQWGKWVVGGYQADMNGTDEYTGILYEERGRGIVALRGQKVAIGEDHKPQLVEQSGDAGELQKKIKKGDWNTYRVVALGNHLQHFINGQLMADITDNDPQEARFKGILALQLHAGPPMKVQFRNIRIKELPSAASPKAEAGKKKIVLVAGAPSHGFSLHEHYAGCMLLAEGLRGLPGVEVVVVKDGWPQDARVFEDADAIVLFSDGGEGNPMLQHVEQIDKLMKQGVGLTCIHYAVDVPKDKLGGQMKDWIGGYFETHWSVNPMWKAEFKQLPDHPIARGVKPFAVDDEWYYHMRFADNMEGVTPILTATPPDATRDGADGPYSGNPTVRAEKGKAEHVAWARQRADGGRGFGFTGGHYHWNWANPNYRTIVLNGIAWTAKIDVPANGVPSKSPTLETMQANLSRPAPDGFDWEGVRKTIEQLQK